MIRHKKMFWVGIGCMAIAAFGVIAFALKTRGAANDLGLTRSDLAIGGLPDVEALRAKTKAVADAYLAQHESELKEICGGSYELNVDYSLSPKIRSLGYRSSFYYYCWDIYIPYSIQSNSGTVYTVIVQLLDKTEEHTHDPDMFHVLRAIVIDSKVPFTRIELGMLPK